MANKLMENCSTSSVIRKMQIKIAMRCRLATIRKVRRKDKMLVRIWGNRKFPITQFSRNTRPPMSPMSSGLLAGCLGRNGVEPLQVTQRELSMSYQVTAKGGLDARQQERPGWHSGPGTCPDQMGKFRRGLKNTVSFYSEMYKGVWEK